MSPRSKIGLRLAASAIGFLALTVVCALALRDVTGDRERLGRGPASVESRKVFEDRGVLSRLQLENLGSTPLLRGRRVVFHQKEFLSEALSDRRQVALNLFQDLTLIAQLQKQPVHEVNEEIYIGQIFNNEESEVRILIENGIVDGTVKYEGLEYRIIDGANGELIITEAKSK